MALKDWKKSKHQEDKWVKKNDSIEIIENHDKQGNIDYYTLEIFIFETPNETAKWLKTRRFRQKSQAIKHAKLYMKKN